MADARHLRPSELARLLNSTAVGAVIIERQLHRHRTRAGFRIGDGKSVDLLRYLAWLADEVHAPRETPDAARSYATHREAMREKARLASESGRDIGDLPPVADPHRRATAERSFRAFCESYFPDVFALRFSDDHLTVIAKTEQAVLHGGLFALAMPRGSGKTTIAECACLWAILYSVRQFARHEKDGFVLSGIATTSYFWSTTMAGMIFWCAGCAPRNPRVDAQLMWESAIGHRLLRTTPISRGGTTSGTKRSRCAIGTPLKHIIMQLVGNQESPIREKMRSSEIG